MNKTLLMGTLFLTASFSINTTYALDETVKAKPIEKKMNDYPTQARVEYVLQCMSKYGKKNYNMMYGCICAVDKVAETIPYKNYVSTATLAVMINTPGEKGGIFRDAPGGRKAVKAFKEFINDTEKSCGLSLAQQPASNK